MQDASGKTCPTPDLTGCVGIIGVWSGNEGKKVLRVGPHVIRHLLAEPAHRRLQETKTALENICHYKN